MGVFFDMSKPLLIDARALGARDPIDGWTITPLHGADLFDAVTREPNESMVKQAAKSHPDRQLAILNVEHWPLPAEMDKYIQVVDWWREVRPEVRLGYYAMLPIQAYWQPILGGDHELNWKQENAALARGRNKFGQFAARGLVDVVDFVCPSLYPFYELGDGAFDHESLWFSHYAPANIKAAREYQKQVYPFLWPRIHKGDMSHTASADFLRRQIQFCIDHADGCIIWDSDHLPNALGIAEWTNEIMREFV